MKKLTLITFLFTAIFLLTGCNYFTIEKQIVEENEENKENIFVDNMENAQIIMDYIAEEMACDDNGKMFVDIAILGYTTLENGGMEYYIVSNAQGYFINSRGDLTSGCGFKVPMKITISGDKVIDVLEAKDGNEYDNSIKEMFSKKAYDIFHNAKYAYINEKTLLEMAEEYFQVKIIPEEKNEFECKFCDVVRYRELTLKSNMEFDYIAENNGQNSIYFDSDGTFEAKGSWDEGSGTWVFGKDENTAIVVNSKTEHVYDRYIITNVDEDNLTVILEIIQRR